MFVGIKNIIQKYEFEIFLAIVLLIIVKASLGPSLGFFFWKDDWFLKWAATYNPSEFIGKFPYWQLRSPEYFLRQFIVDSYTWQYIGLIMKFVNSIAVYFFMKSVAKNKKAAVIASLLFAAYSGGGESYTWAIATSFLITTLLIGLIYYENFLSNFDVKSLIVSAVFFTLTTLLYFGRALGLVPLLITWTGFSLMIKYRSKKMLIFFITLISTISSLFALEISTSLISEVNRNMYSMLNDLLRYENFFASIGNLLRNPLWPLYELAGLSIFNVESYRIGLFVFILGILLTIKFYKTLEKEWLLASIFILWIYFFYFFNWIYGGGGVNTIVGSTHRYLSISALGLVFFVSLVISKFKKIDSIVITIALISISLATSHSILNEEAKYRHRSIVEPIYEKLHQAMSDDPDVEVIVFNVENEFKSLLVQGWYPYAYGYYKGVDNLLALPTVIPHRGHAINWICAADPAEKTEIERTIGFVDYQDKPSIDPSHVYSWVLDINGELKDDTEVFRKIYLNCKDKLSRTNEN